MVLVYLYRYHSTFIVNNIHSLFAMLSSAQITAILAFTGAVVAKPFPLGKSVPALLGRNFIV